MSDKSLGSVIFSLGLIGVIVYLYWLFVPANASDLLFYCPWINARWALVLPVVIAVVAILFIAMWIGWTMIMTPPPTMIEEESETKTEDQKEGA